MSVHSVLSLFVVPSTVDETKVTFLPTNSLSASKRRNWCCCWPIYSNRLVQTLPRYTTGVNVSLILNLGASKLEQDLTDDTLQGARKHIWSTSKDSALQYCNLDRTSGATHLNSKGTKLKQKNENANLGEKGTV